MFHNLLLAYFGGFFIFWTLGLDQLFFLILCLVGFFSYVSSKKISPGIDVILFAVFIAVTFFSVLQVSTGMRYVTYIRNESVYIAMLFVFLSATFLTANKESKVDKLYFAIFLFSVQCSIVAFLASRGYSLSFKSVAGHIIPDLGSKYISGMLNKNSVQAEASWFSKGFFRPRGLMMYPNTMAGILASTMAIKAYFIYKFWRDGLMPFAVICLGLIVLDVFSIYSSLSRSTWIGMAIAFIAFPFAFKTSMASKTFPIVLGVVGVVLLFATGLNEGIESRLVDKTHSNEGRGLNYTLIWQETTSSIDKLLFGHGTQIDHWLLGIPLGSHSTYLGVFFKYGLFGFTLMTLFLIALYARSLSLTRYVNRLNSIAGGYVRPYFLCFALIIPVVQMMFIEVDVDVSYALYFSVIVLLIILECQLVHEKYQRVVRNVINNDEPV